MKNYKLIAKTFSGLEYVLADELKSIGAKNIRPGHRATFFDGNLETIYKANYFLRTALRILKEIENFQFKDVDQFYLKCKNVKWSDYFGIDENFVINSTVVNSVDFKNSMFASLRTKDAIADFFRESTGKRPNVDTENPDIIINVHIHQDNCTLSIDSTGESLHKRGYRVKQGEAPLNEVLAAGMIHLSGWRGNSDFMDPMCGSGTLPIEAAMIAQNIPAGKFRKDYAFEKWRDYDQLLWEKVRESFTKKEFTNKIYASDVNGSNLLNAQTNARRALVFNKITFEKADFRDLNIPLENATILTNPPYGERLREENLNELYSMIGERLKHHYAGNSAWILSSALESLKFVGLKTSAKLDLFNGSLKCKFNNYRLFAGKLRN
ncbi:MAG: class I SAM-dependent RNA methyltransferase [Bacteroidetes bacterium]|nr:class I SAM-dependent RNA methyltransferase [Bacteroidota bacterium]